MKKHKQLISNLPSPSVFNHEVENIQTKETHISWIILTGPYAYKIKKPVDLDFLDFSTLEKRKYYCEEELRLNRRTAPDLYLGVLPITGSYDEPVLNGSGKPIEWCVKMKQFPDSQYLPRQLEDGNVSRRQIKQLARYVARFHEQLEPADPDTSHGNPTTIRQATTQNFDQILPLLEENRIQDRVNKLRGWSDSHFEDEYGWFERRKRQGYIRECHGDMHLRNMFVDDGQIKLFDCIEFNEDLRWIDVINDVACLLVDLDIHNYSELAHRFLNTYLNWSADYEGVAVLRFYRVYRAMVRAKVALMDHSGEDIPRKFLQYLESAENTISKRQPFLAITRGPSASGKSTGVEKLMGVLDFIRLQTDVIRKQIHGLEPDEESNSGLNQDMYTEEANRQTYETMAENARLLLQAGYPVIADGAFLDHNKRHDFYELSKTLNVPFRILNFTAPEKTLKQRVENRDHSENPSEAGIEVLEYQLSHRDPLTEQEEHQALTIDTTEEIDNERILSFLQ
ncbi:MAG: AAA family ATPase [bacterium]